MRQLFLLSFFFSGCSLFLLSPFCGDGITNNNEECDGDPNCLGDCTFAICGDGIVGGTEQCDDGNNLNGDGCQADCTTLCGDSIVVDPETCDDGNTTSGDGCSSLCVLEVCGDGIINNNQGDFALDNPTTSLIDASPRLAVADLDADGLLDVVIAQTSGNRAGFVRGLGDGTFDDPVFLTVGTAPVDVVVVDLDNNGTLDVATANQQSNNVSVILNDGALQPAQNFSAGVQPVGIVALDINNDSFFDLAVPASGNNSAFVLLNRGPAQGSLFPDFRILSDNNAINPRSIAQGDLNGDVFPDLVTGNQNSSNVAALLVDNTSNVLSSEVFEVTGIPASIELKDLNRDTLQDVVTADSIGSTISVLLGNGDGTFGPAQDFFCGNGPKELTTGDINLDGLQDVITANGNEIGVLLGNGDGSFQSVISFSAAGVEDVKIGDFNGDGRPDLAGVSIGSDNLTVLLNLSALETCDDGNTTDGDGCSGACLTE